MKKTLFKWIIIFALSLPGVTPALMAQNPTAKQVVDKSYHLFLGKNSFSVMSMTIVRPNWQRTITMQNWSLGDEFYISLVTAPARDKGQVFLKYQKDMWNYIPAINRRIKIPPSMMMQSWMGSDFTNDDLVREFTLLKDYTFQMSTPRDAVPGMLYLEARPKPDVPVVWDRLLIEVRKTDLLPVSEKYFDESGRKIREITFAEIRNFDGRKAPAVLTLIPAGKPGRKTVIRYLKLRFDPPIPSGTFTLRHLRRPESEIGR